MRAPCGRTWRRVLVLVLLLTLLASALVHFVPLKVDVPSTNNDANGPEPSRPRRLQLVRRDERPRRRVEQATAPAPTEPPREPPSTAGDIRECVGMVRTPQTPDEAAAVSACVEACNRGPGSDLNFDRYPLPAGGVAGGVVVVIPTHNRVDALREVLRAWEDNADINTTTLIVSHDGFFQDVHELVQAVRFARVKQLYHPYAASFLPGALWAEPLHRFARLKHHFWWLFNYVWRHRFTPDFMPPERDVLVNEDDLLVAPDALAAATALFRLRRERMADEAAKLLCVNLGVHRTTAVAARPVVASLKLENVYRIGVSRFASLAWGMSGDGMGRLLAQAEAFCGVNEYNWDWTVAQLTRKGLLPDRCLSLAWPRGGFHVGSCNGTHVHLKKCEPPAAAAARLRTDVFERLREAVRAHASADNSADWAHVEQLTPPAMDAMLEVWLRARGGVQTPSLNEGWTSGRIWPADLDDDDPRRAAAKTSELRWTSDAHRAHCLALASAAM